MKTLPDIESLLQSSEHAISDVLIPSLKDVTALRQSAI